MTASKQPAAWVDPLFQPGTVSYKKLLRRAVWLRLSRQYQPDDLDTPLITALSVPGDVAKAVDQATARYNEMLSMTDDQWRDAANSDFDAKHGAWVTKTGGQDTRVRAADLQRMIGLARNTGLLSDAKAIMHAEAQLIRADQSCICPAMKTWGDFRHRELERARTEQLQAKMRFEEAKNQIVDLTSKLKAAHDQIEALDDHQI